MAEAAAQEKTERATPRRRQDARKKGQVAQSREVSSVLILMTTMGVFYFAGSWIFYNLFGLFSGIYENIATPALNTVPEAVIFSRTIFDYLVSILVPIFLPIVVAALVANVVQVGFEMHGQPLLPKLSKLNPIAGMKKFVSLKSLVELLKSLAKIVIVGGIAYVIIAKEMIHFPSLMQKSVVDILLFIASVAFKIFFFVCLVLIVVAALDYIYQYWQHEKNLKMTKQEVKDERKQTEGDPKIKARIRSIQLEMAQRRMMEAIPEADVVITNPTHLALAIKFDAQEMIAPQVLAKGSGFIAERIKEIAREHNVPVVEDKPLAQTMFRMVEVGDFIPVELYRAVAEVLAYVYRLKGMYAGA
ncbi:MAG: flagellar biosynthesis protein FlhB [Deltaproteobacteria bacterium]|jgi:flagellar biosynthetic protein FlhB|nr:flagellar biosynthesis protein FlhB [Deltaproteobacteria bacterium]